MLDVIFSRRSIRKFETKPVEKEKVDTLLRAGMYAPSAHNIRPWHFVVVTDRKLIEDFQAIHPYSRMLSEAPILLVVCADTLKKERYKMFCQQDCSAAIQNILLAARSIGLGTCWLGLMPGAEPMEGLKKLLGLPEGIEPVGGIAVGYPAEEPPMPERFDESVIHYNGW